MALGRWPWFTDEQKQLRDSGMRKGEQDAMDVGMGAPDTMRWQRANRLTLPA